MQTGVISAPTHRPSFISTPHFIFLTRLASALLSAPPQSLHKSLFPNLPFQYSPHFTRKMPVIAYLNFSFAYVTLPSSFEIINYKTFHQISLVLLFVCLRAREQEEGPRGRERENLKLMTWAETNNWTLNQLSHSNVPSYLFQNNIL